MAREIRQEEAHERALARELRTAPEQIAVLDARLGVGVGAVRERMRLDELILLEDAASSETVTRKRVRRGKRTKDTVD
jgi:hypothetical protein